MERYAMSSTDVGIHIDGFPDAAGIVQLESPQAARLADLARRAGDLRRALGFLDAISDLGHHPNAHVIHQGLWCAAVVTWRRCFNDGVGTRLQRKLYGEGVPQQVFDYFTDLRDKHFAHDVSPYAESIPAAVVAAENVGYNVEKIVVLDVVAETLTQENFGNLHLLVATALDHVEEQFDRACAAMTRSLEAAGRTALLSMSEPSYSPPEVGDIRRKRR